MFTVKWHEANAGTNEQEMAVPTHEQMSKVSLSRKVDLFKTTCQTLRLTKAIEQVQAREKLMPWFRGVITLRIYEHAKRYMPRNTEAYQSFHLYRGPGAYKRVFLTHRNAVRTAVKQKMKCLARQKARKREVLQADLELNVNLCLHHSFCRNREQIVNEDILPCCNQRLLEQERRGTARNSVEMLQKVLEDSEISEEEDEAME